MEDESEGVEILEDVEEVEVAKLQPRTATVKTGPSSKLLIITPDQIAKLGLTQQLSKVVRRQVQTNKPAAATSTAKPTAMTVSAKTAADLAAKKNIRISKITILNPDSPTMSIAASMKSKLTNLLKNRKDGEGETSNNSTKTEGRIVGNDKEQKAKGDGRQNRPIIVLNDTNKSLTCSTNKDDKDDVVIIQEKSAPDSVVYKIAPKSQTKKPIILNVKRPPAVSMIKKPVDIVKLEETESEAESPKPRINVLKNEPISLPDNLIASLRSQLEKPLSRTIVIAKPMLAKTVNLKVGTEKKEVENVPSTSKEIIKIENEKELYTSIQKQKQTSIQQQKQTVLEKQNQIEQPTIRKKLIYANAMKLKPEVIKRSSIIVTDSKAVDISDKTKSSQSKIKSEVIDLTDNKSTQNENETDLQSKPPPKKPFFNRPAGAAKQMLSKFNTKKFWVNDNIIKTYSKKTNERYSVKQSPEREVTSIDLSEVEIIEEQIKNENSNVPADSSQSVKPTPKKRGRKSKAEMLKAQLETPPPIIVEAKIETSARGRKRKVVNYMALAEGNEFDEVRSAWVKRVKRSDSVESESENNEEVKEVKEDSPKGNLNVSASEEPPVKRKRGRPPKRKIVEATSESESANTSTQQPAQQKDISISEAEDAVLIKTESDQINESPDTLNSSQETDLNSSEEKVITFIPFDSALEESTLPPKKRKGRPPKGNSEKGRMESIIFQQIKDKSASGQSESATEEESTPITTPVVQQKRRPGRRKKIPSAEETALIKEAGGTVVCAVCDKEFPKYTWNYHKYHSHNNLAWKVGDPPLDLEDQKVVMSILQDLYKRRKPLHCEVCGEQKKSVMGYLSHKSMCQKSGDELLALRVECEYCHRTVLPVSLSAHLKYCRGTGNPEAHPLPPVEGLPTFRKRKAAEKAHDLINLINKDEQESEKKQKRKPTPYYANFDYITNRFTKIRLGKELNKTGVIKCKYEGCSFETVDVKTICTHLQGCENKPSEGFTCKFCIIIFKTKPEVIDHFETVHGKAEKLSDFEGETEDDDDETEDLPEEELSKRSLGPNLIMHGIKFLLKSRKCAGNANVVYPVAFSWMLQFCEQNFSIPNLFPNWRTDLLNWEKFEPSEIVNYLPHLKYSVSTAFVESKQYVNLLNVQHQWQRFKLFEAKSIDDTAVFFCGGPISAMAWAPTPFYQKGNCDQILAVSVSQVDVGYALHQSFAEPGLMQFWNCGKLTNNENITDPPKLEFCLAHNHGPIWCLEWCPSGCYDIQSNDNSLQRLGVVAVGSADSNVYLYSICFPDLFKDKIVKSKPILKLSLDTSVDRAMLNLEGHVTKLSWTKASGHSYIAAGYANGMVAVFDLLTSSSLLQSIDQNAMKTLMPFRVIHAHSHAITALSLYHLNNGQRWLMTGSIDRSLKYWDLENTTSPISNFFKIVITDGIWLHHWLCSVATYIPDISYASPSSSTVYQVRCYESDWAGMSSSMSRISCVDEGNWTNTIVLGTAVGEIQVLYPHQMFLNLHQDKTNRQKKTIVSFTALYPKETQIESTSFKNKNIEEAEELKKELFSSIASNVEDLQENSLKSSQENSEETNKPEKELPNSDATTYEEAEERYGLIFADIKIAHMKEGFQKFQKYVQANKNGNCPAANQYPLQNITKIACNPNYQSYLCSAIGYQTGFVRIKHWRFLKQ